MNSKKLETCTHNTLNHNHITELKQLITIHRAAFHRLPVDEALKGKLKTPLRCRLGAQQEDLMLGHILKLVNELIRRYEGNESHLLFQGYQAAIKEFNRLGLETNSGKQ